MATDLFKCAYCEVSVQRNATMVHTEREPGVWDLDSTMCRDCFKQFKGMLEKVKSQKSWSGWAAREQEVESLQKEVKSLNSELQFLRQGDPICNQLLIHDPHNEVVTVTANGCAPIKAHRSILITRSEVFKKVLMSEEFKMQLHDGRNRHPGQINLNAVMHADSFLAFIQFLYTAELRPEVLQDHAADLIRAADRYEIPILKSKCEDFIVRSATPENAIAWLKVADQCNSPAITAAAVKQMRSNPIAIVHDPDFEALQKCHPAALAGAFKYIILEPPAATSRTKSPTRSRANSPARSSVPGSDPNIHSALPSTLVRDRWSLGMCTCSVHPFAHSGFEYHGVHFNTVTPQPSNVNYVDMNRTSSQSTRTDHII